jgi:hypothetical protein
MGTETHGHDRPMKNVTFFLACSLAGWLCLPLIGHGAEVTCKHDTYSSAAHCSDGTTWREDSYGSNRAWRSSDGTVCTRNTYGSPSVTCKGR